jgi:hypothetical protein
MNKPVVSIAAGILALVPAAPVSIAALSTGKAFDGVWASAANVTLIKEMKNTLIMQGKDPESTWQARCVKKAGGAICRGSGVRNEGEEFVYESTMTLKDGAIEEAWKATFAENQSVEGKDTLKLVPIAQR